MSDPTLEQQQAGAEVEKAGPEKNPVDRGFRELNRQVFGQDWQVITGSTTPPEEKDEQRRMGQNVEEMEKSLDQLSDERKLQMVSATDVSVGLGEVYRLMTNTRGQLDHPDNLTREYSTQLHGQARELFLAAGKKLWPTANGSSQSLNFAVMRLGANTLKDFMGINSLVADGISKRGGFVEGKPPTSQQEQSILDGHLNALGTSVGGKVWELAGTKPDSQDAFKQKGLLGDVLKQAYVIERYRDSLTLKTTPSANVQ